MTYQDLAAGLYESSAGGILGKLLRQNKNVKKPYNLTPKNLRKVHMYAFGKPILIGHTFSIN